MAFTRAPVTALAAYGGPGPIASAVAEAQSVTDTVSVSLTDTSSLLVSAAISVTDTLSVSVTDSSALAIAEVTSYVTELGAYGGPFPYQTRAASAPASTVNLDVSDTLAVALVESPVDEQQIETADTLRVALVDNRSLFNDLGVSDSINVALSETVALVIAGIVDKPVTDTLSVALSETAALGITLDVTDTLSVSLTDTSAVATSVEAISVTDTLSVSVDEVAVLQVFSGVAEINVGDVLGVVLTDVLTVVRATPADPTGAVKSIRFEIRGPSMRFEFL